MDNNNQENSIQNDPFIRISALDTYKGKVFIGGIVFLRKGVSTLVCKTPKSHELTLIRCSNRDEFPELQAYAFSISVPVKEKKTIRFEYGTEDEFVPCALEWGKRLKKRGRWRFINGYGLVFVNKKRGVRIVYGANLESEVGPSSWPNEEAKQKAIEAHEIRGMSVERYFANQLWNYDMDECAFRYGTIVFAERLRNAYLKNICRRSGLSSKDVRLKRVLINALANVPISLRNIEVFGLCELEINELLNVLPAITEITISISEVRKAYKECVDTGISNEVVTSFNKLVDKCAPLLNSLFVKDSISQIASFIQDPNEQRRVVADMHCTHLILGYTFANYTAFHFWDKSLEERSAYITRSVRNRFPHKLNERGAKAIMEDKWKSFEALKPYYHRDVALVSSIDDLDTFKQFVKKHKTFIVKPLNMNRGNGVSLEKAPLFHKDKFCEEFLNRYGEFIIEERLIQHSDLARLNESSVNTVRLYVRVVDNEYRIGYGLVRIGRAGSLVDNGAKGGIVVGLDCKTGRLYGNGYDEHNYASEVHPDSNVKLDGYQLPNWQGFLSLLQAVYNKIPGANFAGWDFACREDGTWCVIELNGFPCTDLPQLIAGRGLRKEFIEFLS